MKIYNKYFAVFLVLFMVTGFGLWAQSGNNFVDTYTSASETKSMLSGAAFDAVANALQTGSSDLASAAKAKSSGYVAPKSFLGNVMSVNPDGSVGISTISQWLYTVKRGTDSITLQLTYGQNAVNLAEKGMRGTLFVPGVSVDGKAGRYFIHFKVTNVDVMKYSDEAYNAGKFNSYYSGQAEKRSQYTITCDVLAIEECSNSVKLGIKMP